MRNLLLPLLLLLAWQPCSAQKSARPANEQPRHTLQVTAQRFLPEKNFGGLPDSSMLATYVSLQFPSDQFGSIRLEDERQSLTAHHFNFRQYIGGVPVFGSFLRLSLNSQGKLIAGSKALVDLFDFVAMDGGDSKAMAIQYLETLKAIAIIDEVELEQVLFPMDNLLIPATRVRYNSFDQSVGAFEKVIDGEGNVLFIHDLRVRHHPPSDTLVNVKVYNPDPVTTAQVSYGTPYVDGNDTSNPALDAERFDKTVSADFVNGTFHLRNRHCQIAELSTPVVLPCTSSTPFFLFDRSNDCFEQVNALYHISQAHLHVEALGFNLPALGTLRVDANALNGDDNSQFVPSGNYLLFGEGGVDDAEDADVIIHEYAHAISEAQAPGTRIGQDREALDEAFGDYLASSYSKSLSLFEYREVFSWDGHNPFFAGRTTLSNKTYADRSGNSIYRDGTIWAAAMMDLNDALGREYMDQLLIETHAFYFPFMTMRDAAQLLLVTNRELNGQSNESVIARELLERKLLESPPQVSLRNGFITRPDGSIDFLFPERWLDAKVSFTVYSSHGQFIEKRETVAGYVPFTYQLPHLASGMYIVRVIGPDGGRALKFVRE